MAAFPFCSLENRGSAQARAGFSSWIHMKRPRAACSLPSCSASWHGSGSGAREGNRGAEAPCSRQSRKHNAGETKSGAVFTASPVPFTSAWSWFPLFMSLLTRRSLSSAAPEPRAWIRLPLQIQPAKHIGHKEPGLCVRPEALSSLCWPLGLVFVFQALRTAVVLWKSTQRQRLKAAGPRPAPSRGRCPRPCQRGPAAPKPHTQAWGNEELVQEPTRRRAALFALAETPSSRTTALERGALTVKPRRVL